MRKPSKAQTRAKASHGYALVGTVGEASTSEHMSNDLRDFLRQPLTPEAKEMTWPKSWRRRAQTRKR